MSRHTLPICGHSIFRGFVSLFTKLIVGHQICIDNSDILELREVGSWRHVKLWNLHILQHLIKWQKNKNQAWAELCQVQFKLGQAKQLI